MVSKGDISYVSVGSGKIVVMKHFGSNQYASLQRVLENSDNENNRKN